MTDADPNPNPRGPMSLVNPASIRITFLNETGSLDEVSNVTLGCVALAIDAELRRRDEEAATPETQAHWAESDWAGVIGGPLFITCRFCGGTDCEHGDDCGTCGCPECGFPGATAKDDNGVARNFCGECDWEGAPGAYAAWKSGQKDIIRQAIQTVAARTTTTDDRS